MGVRGFWAEEHSRYKGLEAIKSLEESGTEWRTICRHKEVAGENGMSSKN